jgi:hypothetical protein
VPAGISPLAQAVARARKARPPAKLQSFPIEFQWLTNVCRELQRDAGEKTFYLDGRSVATRLGIPHRTVASWLKVLCSPQLGILQLIRKGRRGQASEYRYVANVPSPLRMPDSDPIDYSRSCPKNTVKPVEREQALKENSSKAIRSNRLSRFQENKDSQGAICDSDIVIHPVTGERFNKRDWLDLFCKNRIVPK